MPTPEQADAISQLGAFALFVLITIFIGAGLYRRWWVPGWFYDQEKQARLTAETQATRNAEALETTNASLGLAIKELASLRRDIEKLRAELRAALSRRPDA